MMNETTASSAGGAASALRPSAICLIAIGVAAIILPEIAGIGVSVVFGVAILLAGFAYGVFAFAAMGTGTFLWRLLVSAGFTFAGIYLTTHPLIGLVTISVIVAAVFFVEGVAELASYIVVRSSPRSGVLLVNAALSFVLALLIWQTWPSSSAWAVGTLVGINLITTGITQLLFAPFAGAPRSFG